jgi:hypothetical protein
MLAGMVVVSGAEPTPVLPARPPLQELAGQARPVALAGERLLPVLPPLVPLFPGGGLRRGTVVSVTGSTSLALAVLAGPSAAGSWCAAVGLSSLGVVAAAELGVVLERFPLVASPSNAEEWAWAVAALLDAVDVVLARPAAVFAFGHAAGTAFGHAAGTAFGHAAGRPLRDAQARRLAAKARERSAVLVVTHGWPGGADVRLEVTDAVWEGVGEGHGRLRARRMEVAAGGRGAATRERRVSLWLPGPDGGVAPAAARPDAAAAATAAVG